jgi:hypothetical protein
MFILSSENFLQAYKEHNTWNSILALEKIKERNKSKSELVDFNAKLNVQKVAKKSC